MSIDLKQGDCLEVMRGMASESVDAIVTDPPYGIGFNYQDREATNDAVSYWAFLKPIYLEMLRVAKPGALIALWQFNPYLRYAWEWFGDGIHIYAGCKNFVQLRKTPINYAFDPIVMQYKKGTPLRPAHPKRNVDFFVANTAKWVTQTDSLARKHPCPRPIDQVEAIVCNFTVEGALILDPFMGSGTTGVVCSETDRGFIGIEISEQYYNLSKQRILESQQDRDPKFMRDAGESLPSIARKLKLSVPEVARALRGAV